MVDRAGRRPPDLGQMVFGVPAQLRAALDAKPTPDRHLGADDRAAEGEQVRIVRMRVGGGNPVVQVGEIPLQRPEADRFEIDEARPPVHGDVVAIVR